MSALTIDAIRDALPSARASAYFNAGTFGPIPTSARDAMVGYVDRAYSDGRIGSAGYAEWHDLTEAARSGFAAIARASSTEIAVTHSTTDGVDLVLLGMDWAPGDEVVITDQEHPGLTEPLAMLARRYGIVVRAAAAGPGSDVVATVTALMTSRTRLVAVSHVLWTTGEVLPLARIGAVCAEAGVPLLADGAQWGGGIVDPPTSLAVDYFTYSGQKWLLGPSGSGALWVRPQRLAELHTAWPWYASVDRSSGAAVPWPDCRRLDAGTISLGAFAGAAAALRFRVDEVGIEEGATASLAVARQVRAALEELPGVEVVPVAEASQLVTFALPGREAAAIVAALEDARVLVRSFTGLPFVRVSCGFWNDEGDVDRLVEAVKAAR